MTLTDDISPDPLPPPSRRDEAQRRVMQILEATTDVVAMIDREGWLFYLNATGRRLFGWEEEDTIRHRSIEDIHPSWAYEVVQNEAFPTAHRDGSWSGETALTVGEAHEIPVLQVVLAHTDEAGELEFYSTICRDISDRKQKELEQIEWANRYDAAIRASGQVLFDWDSQTGDITYGGDVAKLLGYSEHEMQGGLQRMRELIYEDDLVAFDAQIARVTQTREPFQHEFRVRGKSSAVLLLEAQGYFFLDRAGQYGRMVGFLKDVTAMRGAEHAIQLAHERLEQRVAERTAALEKAYAELERRARQQEAIAHLGQRALASHDIGALMQKAAEAVCKHLTVDFGAVLELDEKTRHFTIRGNSGWPEGLTETPVLSGCESQSGYAIETGGTVISPDFTREVRFSISQKVRASRARSGVSVCIQAGDRPLGVLNAFSLTARAYTADEISFMQAIANVLTAALERHRAEAHILLAQAEAEAANRTKSEFLSRMSHELRTPLNSILGFTQLMEMEENNPRQTENIEHVSRAGQNLLALINEVLDIARLDSGRVSFTLDTLDLAEFLPSLVTLSQPLAQRYKTTLLPVAPAARLAAIRTDRERLRQILLNLLSNAMKYNRPGGTVEVTITQPTPDYWRINVTDTGIGLSPEQLARLFVPFERLGVREGGTEGGTGLGLALCQRLMRALSGHIGVHSILGQGSTFWVEFPEGEMEPPTVNLPPPPEVKKPTPREHTLLYIEDDLANTQLLQRILEVRKGTRLLTAEQGHTGHTLAREQSPHLILLDLHLPDISGEQLLRLLKTDPLTAHIPIIIVTGEISQDLPEKIRQLGATDILLKPYRVQDLFTLLDRVLPA